MDVVQSIDKNKKNLKHRPNHSKIFNNNNNNKINELYRNESNWRARNASKLSAVVDVGNACVTWLVHAYQISMAIFR